MFLRKLSTKFGQLAIIRRICYISKEIYIYEVHSNMTRSVILNLILEIFR